LGLTEFLTSIEGRDLVDILVVAVIVYSLLLLIRGTRAVQVLLGILVLVGISYLAKLVGLLTLEKLVQNFVVVIPFAIIVIFQDQIRAALATFGDTSFWGFGARRSGEDILNDIVRAATDLSKAGTGALIVLEGQQGLREYIEKGVRLDSVVSRDLLVNIFTVGAPLHDGAVIVQNGRIAAAGCFLPLTRQTRVGKDLGTRHRAALGISDETDACAVVVSEETATISLASAGRLTRDLDSGKLHALLLEHLSRRDETEAAEA
jgi:diadenylate cyclase